MKQKNKYNIFGKTHLHLQHFSPNYTKLPSFTKNLISIKQYNLEHKKGMCI